MRRFFWNVFFFSLPLGSRVIGTASFVQRSVRSSVEGVNHAIQLVVEGGEQSIARSILTTITPHERVWIDHGSNHNVFDHNAAS